ncbi:MAG: DUF1476 domain-containing protein [Proteobacteria bacterium]|nr:DUF1476 domain-containing protein [Pseudomonadota bacterium]
MTSFDEREKAQEDKYAHDEELRFKVRARAAKLFGEWSARQLGLPPKAYAAEMVNLVSAGKDNEALVQRVLKDVGKRGQSLSPDLLGEKLNRCISEAKEQFLKT